MRAGFAAFLAALALPALAAEPCKLVRVAEWPVRLVRGLPVVEGAINGKKAGIMLDTGSYATLITKDAAQRLDLWTRATGEVAAGVGGESRVFRTRVQELRIGDATVPDMRVRVVGERPIPGVDFILGDDFFRALDIEFDYAHGAVRLYKPTGDCGKTWLAFWDTAATVVPLENDPKINFAVRINGREAYAMLDSGASSSTVSLEIAEKVGLRRDTPALVPSACAGGLGAELLRNWVGSFDRLAVGGETIRDAKLHVMDFNDLSQARAPDLLLGTDFLRAHHVYVSRHQGKVYFTYAGGLVFPATPELDCEERIAGKSMGEALAAYDEAIAKDPGDVNARLKRAASRLRVGDPRTALVDLDALLKIEPDNVIGLRERARARMALEDYDGALADTGAAIANGMRVPQVYVTRAWIRAAKGDFAGAIAECDEALRLDPRQPEALRMRGRYLFHAGRFEDAEKDFEAHLAVQHNPFDAIWASLARARRGADGKPVLEEWLARSREPAWPEPVMQYLLGRIDQEALMAAAAVAPGEARRRGQLCEARFYAGEQLAGSGKRDAARALFEQARAECPKSYLEYGSAVIELSPPASATR